MLRSIGRSRPAAEASCGHGLIGSTDEVDELIDEQVDDLLVATAGELNVLSL